MSDRIPCPFCGSSDIIPHSDLPTMFCNDCGARGPFDDPDFETDEAAWDHRALPAVSAKHDFAQPDAAAIREAALGEAFLAIDALPEYESPDVNVGVSNAFSAIFALLNTKKVMPDGRVQNHEAPEAPITAHRNEAREGIETDTQVDGRADGTSSQQETGVTAQLLAPAGLSAGGGAEGPFRRDQRDWTEDYAHENGNYMCICAQCDRQFSGHKRRMVCKTCALSRLLNPPTEGQQS